jgi:hypothetical protein
MKARKNNVPIFVASNTRLLSNNRPWEVSSIRKAAKIALLVALAIPE